MNLTLSADDLSTLAHITRQTGLNPRAIANAAISGTLAYHRLHGTLAFLTGDAHKCHGCRFLKEPETDPPPTPPPPNVIPFRV